MQQSINEIIARILSGESTTEDDLFFIDWLEKDRENVKVFSEKEKYWNSIDLIYNKYRFDHRKAFGKFKFAVSRYKKHKSRPSFSSGRVKTYLGWAAAGLLLLGLGSVITYYLISDSYTSPVNYEVKVPVGSRSNIILADGTSLWLNAGSRLTYSSNFGENDRIVHIEGEGYFDVNKQNGHPFTVITSQLQIVATGTSFNVKSYPEEGIIQATLVSGSLIIKRTNHKDRESGLLLEPNQQMTYYKESSEFVLKNERKDQPVSVKDSVIQEDTSDKRDLPKIVLRKGIDPEIFTSWKDNRLIFDNETFSSIAVKFERRFGARIVINDEEIRSKKFKGVFDEISMEQALTALQFASPFDYYIKNDTIYIYKLNR
jgi:transmembrane sensor